MSTPKKTRWLQVAKRASEFRLLQGSGEVAEATQRVEVAQAALEASQHLSQKAQSAWRDRLSKPVFHAADDAQFRHFHGVLKETELRHDESAERALVELGLAQLALRTQLAEKNALKAAIEHVNERFRLEELRTGQKDADEVWSVTQHQSGATP